MLIRHETIVFRHGQMLIRHETTVVRHEHMLIRHETTVVRHEYGQSRHECNIVRHDISVCRHEMTTRGRRSRVNGTFGSIGEGKSSNQPAAIEAHDNFLRERVKFHYV